MRNNPIEELTDITHRLIDLIYAKIEHQLITDILINECGRNLPLCEGWNFKQFERIRFAVIKFSAGQIDKFQYAVKLANIDWRDLLQEVGFAEDIKSHEEWAKKMIEV